MNAQEKDCVDFIKERDACGITNRKCHRGDHSACNLRGIYRAFGHTDAGAPPLTVEASRDMCKEFLQNWSNPGVHGNRAQVTSDDIDDDPIKPGYKQVASQPMENVLRRLLGRELEDLGVVVRPPSTEYRVHDELPIKIRPDARLAKDGYPDTILSCKVWTGAEQLREAYAYAYLARSRKGLREDDLPRLYHVSLFPLADGNKRKSIPLWVKAFHAHLAGAYSLCGEPYFDDLVEELRLFYSSARPVGLNQ
jgi:hypothetical protein